MREILFRGKTEDGKWVEGTPLYLTDERDKTKHFALIVPIDTAFGCSELDEHYKVDPETIAQFTGLTDKNGKKIFEGDVVKTKYGRQCVVVWYSSNLHNGWDLTPINSVFNVVHTKAPDTFDLYKEDNLEVIGNSYDPGSLWRLK